jgi:hypothetical protein
MTIAAGLEHDRTTATGNDTQRDQVECVSATPELRTIRSSIDAVDAKHRFTSTDATTGDVRLPHWL